jgi:hypothetical protein
VEVASASTTVALAAELVGKGGGGVLVAKSVEVLCADGGVLVAKSVEVLGAGDGVLVAKSGEELDSAIKT